MEQDSKMKKPSVDFFSSTQDFRESFIDLNKLLIHDKTSTFILKAGTSAMKESGIFEGDELIVDKALKPINGDIVIAIINNEFLIRRYTYITENGKRIVNLKADNKDFKDIELKDLEELKIWGVVTSTIHKFK